MSLVAMPLDKNERCQYYLLFGILLIQLEIVRLLLEQSDLLGVAGIPFGFLG